ncbi:hypothetical protein DUNSADRAFT_7893 [Dunaliella salina]|uniref:Uncharacterized protein n=1 Tax=Dunaliella salina TaxID=3046 RepID=A0ABQ7GKE2_DUNSA|nr:hypothetical protein DUNSADRAFT_7893 [Dunaliella salina]|eukprot:KAF5835087.1 hypothetical protein DUNSADRAFT_7893 [Dunaliella salina]
MPGRATHDTRYLQDLVGDALARGCAEVITAQPNDPVEYLGQYLLRYVKNVEIVGDYTKDKEAQLEAKKAELEAATAAAEEANKKSETRKEAVLELADTILEPRELLQKAVDLIVKHTAANCAYAAAVAEPEMADWPAPEDPEDPAGQESEDEPDPNEVEKEGEEGEEGEGAPAEQEAGEEEEGDEEGQGKGPKIEPPIDYSRKYLSYVVATAGQEFLISTEMYRPEPPAEEPEEGEAPAVPVPFTFRIIDEKRPMIYAPNVANEPSIRFFRHFPKLGAYQACGVRCPSNGEYKAIIAADTLFPESAGQPLSQEDQDFIWHVSRALSAAYDTVERKAQEQTISKNAKEDMDKLKKALHELAMKPQEESSTNEAAEGEPAAEGGGEGEGEAAGEGEEEQAELKELTEALKAAKTATQVASRKLDLSQAVLAVVKDRVQDVAADALHTMRHRSAVPQATFQVIKAVLHVLGKDPETFLNWKRAFMYFNKDLFKEVHAYDATQERKLDAWARARRCYKALPEEETGGIGATAMKMMEEEMPNTHLGVLLFMWLKLTKAEEQAAAKKAEEEEEAARKAEEEGGEGEEGEGGE